MPRSSRRGPAPPRIASPGPTSCSGWAATRTRSCSTGKVTQPKALAAAAGYRIARSMVRDGRAVGGRDATAPRGEALAGATRVRRRRSTCWPISRPTTTMTARRARPCCSSRGSIPAVARRPAPRSAPPSSRMRAACTRWRRRSSTRSTSSQRTNPEALASLYWAGRSYAAMGDTARAAVRWNEVIARDSMSYYADAAAKRLGLPAVGAGGVARHLRGRARPGFTGAARQLPRAA